MALPGPSRSGDVRARLCHLLERPVTQRIILTLILINAVVLGLETSESMMAEYGSLLLSLDGGILAIFVVEILARVFVYRAGFFRDPWSVFDLTVVAIALVPASGPLAIIRALRVLRVLRTLTLMPSMRKVVGGLLASVPGISSIALVMGIIFYVFAVLATTLFGDAFDEWFGTIGRSLYTLFQVMTLESWSMGIARPVMDVFPLAWVFFVPFILIATFTMLNLFIGVIVSAIQGFHDADVAALAEQTGMKPVSLDDLQQELRSLRSEVAELRSVLQRNGDGGERG
jgi:voltage-gated sodium channel